MISKKCLLKIFIIFFIINISYFLIPKSYAASKINVSTTKLALSEGASKNIVVTSTDPNLGTNLQYSISKVSENEPKAGVSITSYVLTPENSHATSWAINIEGIKEGKAKIMFIIGGQVSPYVTIEVKGKSSSSSGTGAGTGTTENTEVIYTDITNEDFAKQFDPGSEIGGYNVSQPVIKVVIPIVNKILTILQIIGAIVLVLSIAIAGFNGILGAGDGVAEDLGLSVGSSINEYGNSVTGVQTLSKGAISKIIRRAIIGVFFLEGSCIIVKIVFKIITNI